jgi:hypothetical protein
MKVNCCPRCWSSPAKMVPLTKAGRCPDCNGHFADIEAVQADVPADAPGMKAKPAPRRRAKATPKRRARAKR